MHWDSLGFQENPFSTEPIALDTLSLYTGRSKQVMICQDLLAQKNILLIIEGERGVGTTSFGNYLRFSAQAKKHYLTPRNEIRVEPNWNLETLLAAIIANVIRELEFFHPDTITKEPQFKDAKSLSRRIAETYRSFGINALGSGLSYGKSSGNNSQPVIVPANVLGHHLEDLAVLAKKQNYSYGLLLQLNNLDIGAVHDEKSLCYLFNALRDYIQTDGISWLLVGDTGLRQFIAQSVDRLDDIVTFESEIAPLSQTEFSKLIQKRINHYRSNEKVYPPIDTAVFTYLYDVTQGRLRYVFGLLQRLISHLHVGDLTDRLTLDIVQPMVKNLAQDRIAKQRLAAGDIHLLRCLVTQKTMTVSELAKLGQKSLNYTSNVLAKLSQRQLVQAQKKGKYKYYAATLDAMIAYS